MCCDLDELHTQFARIVGLICIVRYLFCVFLQVTVFYHFPSHPYLPYIHCSHPSSWLVASSS
ncbi:hypothetical protein B0H12DRAFT_1107035 [Mycena haematopus]|nr:hypothetical protein B0H12DRAFT_1107035 [Mycena haematopus]